MPEFTLTQKESLSLYGNLRQKFAARWKWGFNPDLTEFYISVPHYDDLPMELVQEINDFIDVLAKYGFSTELDNESDNLISKVEV